MNSKVLECMNQTVAEWVNNPKDCRNVEQFTKDQIRAAIREFAEMSNVMELAEFVDGNPEGEFNFYWKDEVKQALAAFVVENK